MNHARYAALFRAEASERLDELDDALLAFELGPGAEQVNVMFRCTHTIKGMAAAMGYRAVEQVAHALESALDGVRSERLPVTASVTALLFDATRALRRNVESAVHGRDDVRAADQVVLLRQLAQLVEGATGGDARDTGGPHSSPVSRRVGTIAAAAADDHVIAVRLTADCPLKGVRAVLVMARLTPLGVVRNVDPSQSTWHDDTFDGAFLVTMSTAATDDEIAEAVRTAGEVSRVTVQRVGRPVRATAVSQFESAPRVRVDRRRLDTMLELVGELAITRDRLMSTADEADRTSTRALTRVAHETSRLISALHDEIVQARMVPLSEVFDRFPRLVRDIARALGKEVRLVTEGREIELDRTLSDAIGDPLLHLIRNALDHGLENPAERLAARKDAAGQIIVRAVRDRNSIVLQVEDDGRGIDRDVILRRAHAQGVVPQGVRELHDDALLQVLARAGFSTTDAVTTISGRGVGVDVVATRVRAMGGALSVETLAGQGTVFTMRLPVTLAITKALLVEVAGGIFAIPAAHVVEVLEYDAGTTITSPAPRTVEVRHERMPLVALGTKFGHAAVADESHLVVVEAAGRRSALLVDRLIAQQDIVVKSFVVAKESAPWFSGATVLGDGTPALIVDLGSLT